MYVFITLLIGVAVGWIAGSTARQAGMLIPSIVVGVVGSCLGSLTGLVLTGTDDSIINFSWTAVLWPLAGAIILAATLNALQRRPANA